MSNTFETALKCTFSLVHSNFHVQNDCVTSYPVMLTYTFCGCLALRILLRFRYEELST